jgi:general secretion pathway protein D
MTLAKSGCILALCCYAVSAATISVQPPAATVAAGSPVTIDVSVTDASDLFAFQFDVGFTPSLLAATAVTEGELFSGKGVSFIPGSIDNTAGTILFIADSLSGPGPGINGDGSLARISFNTIGPGTAAVQVSNIVLLDSSLADIPATAVAGIVTVTVVPEPATFGMLSAALGLVVVGVRRRPSG